MGKQTAGLVIQEKLGEKCGIFGVYGKGFDAARLTYFGLYALQHRGQESSGITASDGKEIRFHKANGLVAHVYSEENLHLLKGHMAIGHNRYATSGVSEEDHNQPVITRGRLFSLAHNGNLPSTQKIEQFLKKKGKETTNLNDSELMYEAIKYYLVKGYTIQKAVSLAYPLFTGAFSLLIMTKDKVVAVRDECGMRPFSIGTLGTGYVFSSETCAMDTIGATFLRDVKPGEMVICSKNGLLSHQLVSPRPRFDVFEFVYFARPDSVLMGKSVNEVRRNLGKHLAQEYPIRADVVIPVPDSAIPQALGYAQESGIPFDHGLIKNRYIHRTFIQPGQGLREVGVKMKLNPLGYVLKGKRVIIVDDSIVRGTTAKKLVSRIREAGAKEVHLMISSPPVKFPDFYGIDTPHQKDLIAATMTLSQMQEYIGCDTLGFLSYGGLIEAIGLPEDELSLSCFTGEYPIAILERQSEVEYPDKLKHPVPIELPFSSPSYRAVSG